MNSRAKQRRATWLLGQSIHGPFGVHNEKGLTRGRDGLLSFGIQQTLPLMGKLIAIFRTMATLNWIPTALRFEMSVIKSWQTDHLLL